MGQIGTVLKKFSENLSPGLSGWLVLAYLQYEENFGQAKNMMKMQIGSNRQT